MMGLWEVLGHGHMLPSPGESSDVENWGEGGERWPLNLTQHQPADISSPGQVTWLARLFLKPPHQMQNALRKTSEYQITEQ